MSQQPVRIAILGGGLAGAALFRGLSKHSHLGVDIFESAPAFREQGAGIGFNQNAITALEKLGLRGCLDAAGAIRINSARFMVGAGPQAGSKIIDMDVREKGTWITQRTAMLSELFRGADASRMHVGKKLTRFEQEAEDGEIRLFFEDGTAHVCDVLLGADGIHSKIRELILGPGYQPEFAGWFMVWGLTSYEQAAPHLGDLVDPKDPRQYGWSGENCWIMHDLLSDSTMVQYVITQRVPEDAITDPSQWQRSVTKAELQETYRGFYPRVANGVIEIAATAGDPMDQLTTWHHKKHAPSIVKGSIGLVGDAAGATTPWQGSGGGMSMEDAFILSELFAKVSNCKDARAALIAYDQTNRPRRQRIVDSSYETGLIFSGCDPETGIDREKLRDRLEHRWDFIIDIDLPKQRDEANTYMQASIAKA